MHFFPACSGPQFLLPFLFPSSSSPVLFAFCKLIGVALAAHSWSGWKCSSELSCYRLLGCKAGLIPDARNLRFCRNQLCSFAVRTAVRDVFSRKCLRGRCCQAYLNQHSQEVRMEDSCRLILTYSWFLIQQDWLSTSRAHFATLFGLAATPHFLRGPVKENVVWNDITFIMFLHLYIKLMENYPGKRPQTVCVRSRSVASESLGI